MKKQFWVILLSGSALLPAQGQGSVYLSNAGFDVVVRTQFPNTILNGPFTVSLWYLPGATTVPANFNTITYDQYGNQIAGGVVALLNDGYQQLSPSISVSADNGQFNAESVSVPGVTPGGNAVFAVVGWLGNTPDIYNALAGQIGTVSFVNPVGAGGLSPPVPLTGWDDTGLDLVLQYVPIPEPSTLSLSGLAFASLCLIGRKKIRPSL